MGVLSISGEDLNVIGTFGQVSSLEFILYPIINLNSRAMTPDWCGFVNTVDNGLEVGGTLSETQLISLRCQDLEV